MLTPIVLGAGLGGLFVLVARKQSRGIEIQMLALGLVVAAGIYIVLAVMGGADAGWLGLEATGVGVFGLLAWLGVRASPLWLALGWVAHVAWDVGLHLDRVQMFVPAWYPLLCVGFDLVVAGFLLSHGSTGRPSRTGAA